MSRESLMRLAAVIAVGMVLPWHSGAIAQDAEDPLATFYKSKTINLIVGYPPGGANDGYARLVTRFLGQYVPGSPRIILQHMPGAGSANAAAYVYNLAPKDGTVLALLVPTLALEERLGVARRFKPSQFSWIGRIAPAPNVTFVWHASKVKTISDALETTATLGATGQSATNAIYPSVLNSVLGTKFKVVMGYQGSAAAMMAMERGEIEGHSPTFDTLTSLHQDWVDKGMVNIIVQYASKRAADLPDVPTAVELAKSDLAAGILNLVVSSGDIGKSIISTPGLEDAKERALSKAFDAMVQDAQFLSMAREQRLSIDPLAGDALRAIVQSMMNAPDRIVEEAKKVYPMP